MTNTKKTPSGEDVCKSLALNDPTYKALVLAFENGDINFQSFAQYCEDFNFKLF